MPRQELDLWFAIFQSARIRQRMIEAALLPSPSASGDFFSEPCCLENANMVSTAEPKVVRPWHSQ
jgi:hypothetical protein